VSGGWDCEDAGTHPAAVMNTHTHTYSSLITTAQTHDSLKNSA